MITSGTNGVLAFLRQVQVSTVEETRCRLELSRPTVFRALRVLGYFSSLNHNAHYITLCETPVFDPDGLWDWNAVRFSCHGTLSETICALVRRADAGLTRSELESRVGTRVHNQVSALCGDGVLQSVRFGKTAVYLSGDSEQAVRQQHARRTSLCRPVPTVVAPALGDTGECRFPDGVDATETITVLVELIERPRASPADVARVLRRRGFGTKADTVRTVVDFYNVEKKKAQWISLGLWPVSGARASML